MKVSEGSNPSGCTKNKSGLGTADETRSFLCAGIKEKWPDMDHASWQAG